MHTQKENKKEGDKRNGISLLWRKSKIVKIICEYKTLILEEHTISMATSNSYILNYKRRTWKGGRN